MRPRRAPNEELTKKNEEPVPFFIFCILFCVFFVFCFVFPHVFGRRRTGLETDLSIARVGLRTKNL